MSLYPCFGIPILLPKIYIRHSQVWDVMKIIKFAVRFRIYGYRHETTSENYFHSNTETQRSIVSQFPVVRSSLPTNGPKLGTTG